MILRGCCSSASMRGFFIFAPCCAPLWSISAKRARKFDKKIVSAGANMPHKLGRIEVNAPFRHMKPINRRKKERYGRKQSDERASEAGQRQITKAERQACRGRRLRGWRHR